MAEICWCGAPSFELGFCLKHDVDYQRAHTRVLTKPLDYIAIVSCYLCGVDFTDNDIKVGDRVGIRHEKCPLAVAGSPAQREALHGILKVAAGITPQPPPKASEHPAVWDLLMADFAARDKFGEFKYGTRLKPWNGRKTLRDALEEAMDLCMYLRQEIYEREGK